MRFTSWIIFGFAGVAFLGYAAFVYLPERNVMWKEESVSETPFSLSQLEEWFDSLLYSDEITVVLFGVPGEGYRASTLADAIVVVHMRPKEERVYLISIPRDLWVADEKDQFKINDVFNLHKEETVLGTIKTITGLDLDGYVTIDLNTIGSLVDDLGGVDVVLDEVAVDWVSGYILPAGEHHLNGEDAIWLMRNRYNQQGDFFREANQHRVIGAIVERFAQLSGDDRIALARKYVFDANLLGSLQLDFSKLTPLLLSTDFSSLDIESVVLDFSTELFSLDTIPLLHSTSSISVVMPTQGFEQYGAVREYIQYRLTQ